MKKFYLLLVLVGCILLILISRLNLLTAEDEKPIRDLQWSEDAPLTTNFDEDHSLSLLQDITGNIWAVWVSKTYTGEDILYKTFDGTWTSGRRITSSGLNDSSPSIIQDKEGTIWVVWTSDRNRDLEIYYKTFDTTWSDDIKLTENPGEDIGPTIFQNAEGTIWVVWSSFRNNNYDIRCKTLDLEKTETLDIFLTESSRDDYSPIILQDQKGTLWVFWISMNVDNWEIHYQTFDGTWSEEIQVCTYRQIQMNYSVFQDTTGTIWVVWDALHEDNYDIYYKTFDGTWSEEIQLTFAPGHDRSPSIAEDSSGTIWVVWDSERIFGNRDIYYKTFNTTWSEDIRLTENSGKDLSPQIIQDKNTIWVFWDSDREGNQDIYYKTGRLPTPWWLSLNIVIPLVLGSIFFPFMYSWYKKFPVSFNRVAWILTRGRFAPFTEIFPNPYIAGNPIKSENMFFGREDVFKFLNTKLRPGLDVAIVLYGQRRTGKTSILFRLEEGKLGPNFIPVYIDIQAVPTGNDEEFLHEVAKIIMETLENYQLKSFSSLEEFFDAIRGETPYVAFGDFLNECSHIIGEKCLLIMFDEYDRLAQMVTDKDRIQKMIGQFRNWMQTKRGFSFIFAGVHALERMGPSWSLLFNGALYKKISALKKEDALALMKNPVKGLIRYETHARKNILDLSSYNPYILQLMLQNLVDHMNNKKSYRVTAEDIAEIVSDLMVNTPPHFTNLWEIAQPNEQIVLSAAASFPLEQKEILREEIHARLNSVGFKNTEIEEILEELDRIDILKVTKTGNTYYFGIELYRHWIAFAHPFFRVRGETNESVY
jgi:hypothetical protein